MKPNINNLKEWEKNYFGIVSPYKRGQLYYYLKFLNSKRFKIIPGDIVEAGVFRGTSLISSALLISKIKSIKKKKIWAYDTFSGFPSFSKFDEKNKFFQLFKEDKISKSHYFDTLKINKYHKIFKSNKISPKNISSSNNFDNTSLLFIKKKIKFFKLSTKINLVKGDFKNTMKYQKNLPKKISAGLIDCDLYGGYKISLKYFWPRLSINGKLFLDEYFSLKFPGPRFAVNEFLKNNNNAKLIKEGITADFERWSLKKIGK